jgi:two-component system, chemotaxis family, sensor kinase CheA
MSIPDDLVHEFRAVAVQRVERIEAAWAAVLSTLDDDAATSMHRELHTLKGESRMVGFSDVNMVCHKLEDLLDLARTRGYAVDEDFDLAVNMALRFMAMLVRKKVGAQLRGIDLPGFIKQIDGLLVEARPEGRATRSTTGAFSAIRSRDAASPRVSAALRARLGPIAIDAFVEYASARGTRRDRLRGSWHSLRDLIGIQRAVLGAGQIEKHRANALDLARDLGKQLDLVFEIETAEITTEVLAGLDAAVLHLVRNAVDHGIEVPAARAASGKSEDGRIRVHVRAGDDRLVLVVEDDGRGVAIDEVLARARDLGLVAPDGTTRDWFELVCQPGFSTRAEAGEISGRGVGLDVVRGAIGDLGGSFAATTSAGAGTTWTVKLPLPRLAIAGHVFRVRHVPFPFVVDEAWVPTQTSPGAPVIDLALRLGLVPEVERAAATAEPPCYLTNGKLTIGLISDRAPSPVQARRLIAVAPPAFAEVVTLDTVEGLLVHPERMVTFAR